jgi:pilus assembly protein CpaE
MARGKPLNVVGLFRGPEHIELLRHACDAVGEAVMDVRPERLREAVPHLVNGHAPDVLFVELGFEDGEELRALAAFVRDTAHKTTVFATGSNASPEDVQRVKQAGAAAFLPQPLKPGAVAEALSAVANRPAGSLSADHGRTIAVLHASGGAGATTVALELAALLATRGKTVGFLDLDVQFGDAATLLDVCPETSLVSLIEQSDAIDPAFVRKLCVNHRSGVNVLAAPAEVVPLEVLTPRVMRRLLDATRMAFGTTILDLPQAWSEWTLAAVQRADLAVVVTGLRVPDLARTNRLLRGLRDHGLGDTETVIVANRTPRFWAREPIRQGAEALGREIPYAIVRDDDVVRDAHDRGVSIGEAGRGRRIAKDLRKLAAGIMDLLATERSALQSELDVDRRL